MSGWQGSSSVKQSNTDNTTTVNTPIVRVQKGSKCKNVYRLYTLPCTGIVVGNSQTKKRQELPLVHNVRVCQPFPLPDTEKASPSHGTSSKPLSYNKIIIKKITKESIRPSSSCPPSGPGWLCWFVGWDRGRFDLRSPWSWQTLPKMCSLQISSLVFLLARV